MSTAEDGSEVAVGAKTNTITLDPFPISTYEAYHGSGCDGRTYEYCTLYLKFQLVHNLP